MKVVVMVDTGRNRMLCMSVTEGNHLQLWQGLGCAFVTKQHPVVLSSWLTCTEKHNINSDLF